MKEQVGLTAEERAELVAWMLGEADAQSAERVQLALAQQPAWAAERARLEGVLGLLQEVRPAGGEAAPEALLSAARVAAGRRRGWRVLQRPMLALASAAAGVSVLFGLWSTGQFADRFGNAPSAAFERVAALDRPAAPATGTDITAEQRARLAVLGYSAGPSLPTRSTTREGELVVRGESLAQDERLSDAVREKLRGLGYLGEDAGSSDSGVASESDFFLGQGQRAATGDANKSGPARRGPVEVVPRTFQNPAGRPMARVPLSPTRELTAAIEAPPIEEFEPSEMTSLGDSSQRTDSAGLGIHPAVAEALETIDNERNPLYVRAGTGSLEHLRRAREMFPDEWQALQSAGELGLEYEAVKAQAVALIRRSMLEDLLQRCRPVEGETADQFFLRSFGVRPFESTAKKPLATFAASVDTASYTHSRAYLERGELPPADLVRTEAFVNAFRREYADAPPQSGTFALHLELAPSPFGDVQRAPWLLRAAAVARHVAREERKPLALTFAVDVSGSMASANRLPLVQQSLELLLSQLDAHDRVAIVVYSSEAQVLLPMTPASNSHRILEAIRGLKSGGGTNLDGGVYLAFQQAAEHFDPALHNRVVLLSDGVGNIGGTTRTAILDRVKNERKKGIYLNTIGVGMGDQNDALLDDLARTGDGVASYVDNAAQARRAFVEDLVGTFETVARDVKLQMEFDPNQVGRYRLLGYESRALADRAFRDDSVDGGEVNAGHTVVALFELEDVRLGNGPLATLRLVHKPPFGAPGDERSMEQAMSISSGEALGSHRSASPAFRLSAAVAQAAEMLRGSYHRVGARTSQLIPELRAAARDLLPLGAERAAEPNHLADRLEALAAQLDRRVARAEGPARLEADLRFAHFELALERETPGQPDSQRLAELEARVAALEAELLERSR